MLLAVSSRTDGGNAAVIRHRFLIELLESPLNEQDSRVDLVLHHCATPASLQHCLAPRSHELLVFVAIVGLQKDVK